MCKFMRCVNNVPKVTISHTEPILASSASSAWLKRALLWIAAMASGWSCRMACHASLTTQTTEIMWFEGNERVRVSKKVKYRNLKREVKLLLLSLLLWDDRIVQQSVPPLFNFPQSETTAELDTQMNRGQICGLEKEIHATQDWQCAHPKLVLHKMKMRFIQQTSYIKS